MGRSPKDGRRAARVPHDSVLELFDEEGRLVDAVRTLHDVSAVGVSFSSTEAFSKGERIRGRIRILGAGVREFKGRIARFKERENSTLYGVEFDAALR
jgi:PilZ domain